jgi:hypothetical protein
MIKIIDSIISIKFNQLEKPQSLIPNFNRSDLFIKTNSQEISKASTYVVLKQ